MNKKIVEQGLKVDFHIHSISSHTKDDIDILKNSRIENIPILVDKLKKNNVQMCAITDHDVFDYKMYHELKQYEGKKESSLLKVLPGVEFSVQFKRNNKSSQLHVISLFPDADEQSIKQIETILSLENGKPKYDCADSFSESKFIQILSEIDLDTVLIVHQKQTLTSESKPKKNDANSLGNDTFNEFVMSEYFEAFEFKNKKNELFNNLAKSNYDNDLLRFITGSDCHDWSVYPKHDEKSNDSDFKFTYFKCLPTFKGIAFALTDETRISLDDNFFTSDSNNYIEEIKIKENDIEKSIPLSKGINVVIGDNSVGKSLLLHKLTNYYRKDEKTDTSSLTGSIAKNYDEYLEKINIQIESKIDKNHIYEFDTQGEIRKKFNLRKIDSKGFYKNKFPPDVDVANAKRICLDKLDEIYNYLKDRFEYDESIDKIHNLQLLKNNINAKSVTYLSCDNYHEKENEELSIINNRINSAITSLEKLVDSKLESDEINNIKKMVKYLKAIKEKYSNKSLLLDEKIKTINAINTVFKKITDEKTIINTTESEELTGYINKKESFMKIIAEAYDKKNQSFISVEDFQSIKIKPNIYPYLSYKFIKRTNVNMIDKNYMIKLLESPMKRGVTLSDLANISKEKFIDSLKNYDEEKCQCLDYYKDRINKKLDNDLKSNSAIVKESDNTEMSYSDGINSQIYFDITCGDKFANGIYLIDQPEDDVSPSAIKNYLLNDFKKMSKNRQVILVTHNPQFVVNLDADNVIVLKKDVENNTISINSGALEYEDNEINIIDSVANTLEGGIESIKKRWKRYEKDTGIQKK